VKVVDFGIAKAMGGEEGQKVTKTGLVVGTPEYMSPEQLSGDVLDGRSDIYSFALVLFRMLTGTLPFQADSAQETMIKRLTDDPLRLAQARPEIEFPEQLQQVMDRALERMPADRYDSAATFAEDVTRAASGMPAAATGVDTEGATQLIDAGGVTEQLAKTRVASAEEPATPETPMPQPATPPPKKKPVVAIVASVAVLAVGGGAAAVMMSRGGEEPPLVTRQDDSVTIDTAQQVATGDRESSPTGRRQPTGATGTERQQTETGRAVTTPVETGRTETTGRREPPAVDTAAIISDLDGMIEQLFEASQRAGAMVRAEEIYDDRQVPLHLRARAASMVANGHNENGSGALACQWIGQAIALAPTNTNYQKLRDLWGCS
jgi:hypothetical protein